MQAKASVIKVETRTATQSGKEFTVVSLAENFGQGEDRETTYYEGVIFKEDLRNLIKKGQFVEFKGFLTPRLYPKSDGSQGAKAHVRIFGLTVLAEPKPRTENAGQPAAAPAASNAPASSRRSEEDELYARHSAMADAYDGV
jgi:hypothetical protein